MRYEIHHALSEMMVARRRHTRRICTSLQTGGTAFSASYTVGSAAGHDDEKGLPQGRRLLVSHESKANSQHTGSVRREAFSRSRGIHTASASTIRS